MYQVDNDHDLEGDEDGVSYDNNRPRGVSHVYFYIISCVVYLFTFSDEVMRSVMYVTLVGAHLISYSNICWGEEDEE